jgi:hypothetical protein
MENNLMTTQEIDSLLRHSVLDLIELHQDKPVHQIIYALISTGAELARDSALTPEHAEGLISLALDQNISLKEDE